MLLKRVFFIFFLLFSVPAYSQTAENVFQNAIDYTVRIRSSVSVPFLNDHKGGALGAGFVVDHNKGWIATNAHVARRSPASLFIAFKDKDFLPATKLYIDPFLDFAILKIDPKHLPTNAKIAPIACNMPKIGTAVGAFGHPFGLEFTGTRGIISGETDDDIGKFLRTDAPINPGNSGGPLIDIERGEVIGINSAALAADKSQNMNFAIPMHYICKIINLLKAGKNPSPPSISMDFYEPQFDKIQLIIARNFNNKNPQLETGDIIQNVSGTKIKNIGHFVHALRGKTEPTQIQILRSRKPKILNVQFPLKPYFIQTKALYINGLIIGPAGSSDNAIVPYQPKTQIFNVERGSYAEYIEMPAHALIVNIDGQSFGSIDAIYTYLKRTMAKNPDHILKIETLGLQRRDVNQTFALKENFLPLKDLRLIDGQ